MPVFWYLWWVLSNGMVVYGSAVFFCAVTGTDGQRHLPALLTAAAVLTVAVTRWQLPAAFWLEFPLWMLYGVMFLKIRWRELLAPLTILFTLRTFLEGLTAVVTACAAAHLELSNYGPLVQIALSLALNLAFLALLRWLQGRSGAALRHSAGLYGLLLSGALMVLAVRCGLRLDGPAFAPYLSAFRLDTGVMAVLLMTGAAVVFFVVMEMVCTVNRLTEQETAAARLSKQLDGQRRYVEEAEKRTAQWAAFQHDLKNHLLVLTGLLRESNYPAAERYANRLQAGCDALTVRISTGNPVLDALFHEKCSQARRWGISVDCRVRIPPDYSVEDMDLCTIFSNILDNAMAACRMVEPSRRVLRVITKARAGFLVVESTNPVADSRPIEKGIGLRNIETAAARYQGAAEWEIADGIFRISVLLCC